MMKKMRICFLAVVLVVAAAALSACGKTKVDLKEYVSIETNGFDGHGTVEVVVDHTRLGMALKLDEKLGELKDAEDFSDLMQKLGDGGVFYRLQCSADKSGNLKNGDEIKITAKNYEAVEEKYDASFSNTEFAYTVSGLDPVQEIDPFEGVTVSYEGGLAGYDGYSGYRVNVQSPEEYENLIFYKFSTPDGIKAGGTVTVICEYDEQRLAEQGYVVKEGAPESKDFTVEGIDGYITSFDTIDAGTLEEMKKRSISLIKSKYFGKDGDYHLIEDVLTERKNVEYDWMVDGKGKLKSEINYENGYFKMGDSRNSVSLMFSFKVKDRRTSATMYAVVQFDDVIQKASGEIYVEYEDKVWGNEKHTITYLDTSVEEIENELVTNNEFEKVN